jgi:hypothetical protein
MPSRFGIAFFKPEFRPASATGMHARSIVAVGELEIGTLQVRDRDDRGA